MISHWPRDKWTPRLQVWGVALLLSLAQWRHTLFFFQQDVLHAVQAEHGVLAGFPHWRFMQSRLLGPVIEWALGAFGLNLVQGHVAIAVITLASTSIVMFEIGRIIAGRTTAWAVMMAVQSAFALTMSKPWLFVWDYFTLLFAAIFLLLMLYRAPWWCFLCLLAVAYFNHESAVLIGIWMIAQALTDAWIDRRAPKPGMLIGGIGGIVWGQMMVELMRNNLLREEAGWKLFPNLPRPPAGSKPPFFDLQLSQNLTDMLQWVTAPKLDLNLLLVFTLVSTAFMAALILRRHSLRALPLASIALIQALGVLLFQRLDGHQLLPLMPFLCVSFLLAIPETKPITQPEERAKVAIDTHRAVEDVVPAPVDDDVVYEEEPQAEVVEVIEHGAAAMAEAAIEIIAAPPAPQPPLPLQQPQPLPQPPKSNAITFREFTSKLKPRVEGQSDLPI